MHLLFMPGNLIILFVGWHSGRISFLLLQVYRNDAFQELEEVLPALHAAQEALNSLNKNDIIEVKSFSKPPNLVQLTLEGVCGLLGEKADWETARRVCTLAYCPNVAHAKSRHTFAILTIS
jgi:hypothetical protein